jgi:hypothetical protein
MTSSDCVNSAGCVTGNADVDRDETDSPLRSGCLVQFSANRLRTSVMSENFRRGAELLTKCPPLSDLDLAFQVKNDGALKLYTFAHKPADDLPAAA